MHFPLSYNIHDFCLSGDLLPKGTFWEVMSSNVIHFAKPLSADSLCLLFMWILFMVLDNTFYQKQIISKIFDIWGLKS